MKFCSICRKPLEQCQCTDEVIKQWRTKRENEINEKIRKLAHLEEEIQLYQEKLDSYQTRLREAATPIEMTEETWKVCRILWDKGYRLNLEETSLGSREKPVIFIVFSEYYPLNFNGLLSEKYWKYCKHRRKLPVELGPEDDMLPACHIKDVYNYRMKYSFPYPPNGYWIETEYKLFFRISRTQQQEFKHQGILPEDFFEQQKTAFLKWVEQLPPVAKKEKTDADFIIEDGILVKYTGNTRNVTIPDGVTVIGKSAFSESRVQTVILPDSVIKIEEESFISCNILNHIEFSQNLEYIGKYAFCNCSSLKKVVLPHSLKKMEEGVFRYCEGLFWVQLSKSLAEIPNNTFWGCSALARIEIPANIRRIGTEAFLECKYLAHVDFSEGLEYIDEEAFADCPALRQVKLPESLWDIGYEAFGDCYSLTSVQLPKQMNGGLLTGAFSGCVSLKAVQIPENLAELAGTFSGCTSLKEVKFTKGPTIIGSDAFWRCAQLTEVVLPEYVQEIHSDAFGCCTGLTRLRIADGVQKLEAAFSECDQLKEIFLPESIQEIKEDAFEDCENLTIYAPLGSYAEQYAKDHHIAFATI